MKERTFYIRTSAACIAGATLLVVGLVAWLQVETEARHDWFDATCRVEACGAPGSTGTAAASLRLVTIISASRAGARAAMEMQSTNDTICASIWPPTRTICKNSDFQPIQSNVSVDGAVQLGVRGAQPPACRVPAEYGQWLWHGRGECTRVATVAWPHRLVWVAASKAEADEAVAEALEGHRTAAITFITCGAVLLVGTCIACVYTLYWHALHTCADFLVIRYRTRQRRERHRYWRADDEPHGGDSASDDDGGNVRSTYVPPPNPKHEA